MLNSQNNHIDLYYKYKMIPNKYYTNFKLSCQVSVFGTGGGCE